MFGFEPAMLAIIAAAVLAGGVVKGATGVGLPIMFITIMLGEADITSDNDVVDTGGAGV